MFNYGMSLSDEWMRVHAMHYKFKKKNNYNNKRRRDWNISGWLSRFFKRIISIEEMPECVPWWCVASDRQQQYRQWQQHENTRIRSLTLTHTYLVHIGRLSLKSITLQCNKMYQKIPAILMFACSPKVAHAYVVNGNSLKQFPFKHTQLQQML